MVCLRDLTCLMCVCLASAVMAAEPPFACRDVPGGIELRNHGRLVLRYHTVVSNPPEGVPDYYRRSGHIHPVCTPSGRVITSEFPADHLHQHGIFRAWVKTSFQGRKINFWDQKEQTGRVEHVQVLKRTQDETSAGFVVELRHSDITDPSKPKPVLREIWTVRTFDSPAGFAFDIESRQTCIADSPLIVHEYHYGGMAFRGNDQWLNQPEHDFLTSEGRTRKDGNHSRPKWVTAHGRVDGEICSITIMGHPRNFRSPEPVRLHPSKPYFVFTPPFLGEFRLEPEVEHVAKYRFFVNDQIPANDLLEQLWKEWSRTE